MSRHRWGVTLALLLVAGCSSDRPEVDSRVPAVTPAVRLMIRADELVESGRAQAALPLYERVVREYPHDAEAATALYRVGRLQADPGSRLRNYRAAHAAFSRLIADYPASRWEPEARAWRAVLAELLAREDESARLRTQIEHLRRTDLELERR